jgi:hypothetical protein
MTINQRLRDHGKTPMFHRTLNILARQSVDALFPDPPLETATRESSDDESYHVNKSYDNEKQIPKCVVRIQLAKEACAKLCDPPHYRKTLLALVDSGASASIVRGHALPPHVTHIRSKRNLTPKVEVLRLTVWPTFRLFYQTLPNTEKSILTFTSTTQKLTTPDKISSSVVIF